MGYRILGQIAPDATTEDQLYSCPDNTECVVSTIIACNRGAAGTFRLSVTRDGVGTSTQDYLYYDLPLDANDSFALTLGITLSGRDVVRVYASSADFSFSAFGQELSV